jgi:hypothetical protein
VGGCGLDSSGLGKDCWRALVNTIMDLRVPYKVGYFLTSWVTIRFSTTLLHGVKLTSYWRNFPLWNKVMVYNCSRLCLTLLNTSEIWVSHGGEHVDIGLLDCNACGLVGRYQRSEEHTASIFRVEDGGSIFLRNVGIYLQVHTAFQPRRPISTCKRFWLTDWLLAH